MFGSTSPFGAHILRSLLAILLTLLLAGGISACSINEGDSQTDTEEPPPEEPPPEEPPPEDLPPIPEDPTKCSPDSSASTAQITLSGQVTYDRVPADSDFVGLDYSNTTQKPIRLMRIAAVCGTETYDTGTTDINGNYSLTVPNNTNLVIRVRAHLADYDFVVVDNTSNDALYVLDSKTINTATDKVTNLNAGSGWTGSSYTAPRAAAPFAILDSALTAARKITVVDSSADFPALVLNWSPNNVPFGGVIEDGQIGTTFYRQTTNGSEIFILGAAGNDTDEYDDHVIIHEWGHYLEDRFSRSDSIGGPHGGGDKLDMRVAYGEGFGNAWSAIATDEPVYFDTKGNNQDDGFSFNMESATTSAPGWYSETTVQRLLWDFYDQDSVPETTDTLDTMGLGLQPLYNVWIDEQKTTPAMTSIYSFAWALHADQSSNPNAQTWIVNLLEGQKVFGDNIWGDNLSGGQTNSPDETTTPEDDGLPVYQAASIGGTITQACSDKEYGEYNKSTNRQLYRLQTNSVLAPTVTITVSENQAAPTDPDFILYQSGAVVALTCNADTDVQTCGQAPSADTGTEIAKATLEAGPQNYVLVVYDARNVDLEIDDDPSTYDGGRICYDVDIQ